MSRNDFENLQSVYDRTYNRIVREAFRSDIGDNDFTTPEGQMKAACLIKDTDNATTMMLRVNLFYLVRREAVDLHPPIYGIPTETYQEMVDFRPQVQLIFRQDREAVPNRMTPVEAEISFRLMNETGASLTETNARTLAQQIRTELATSNGWTWDKGKYKVNYRDEERGYRLSINALNEAEGEKVIRKILAIRNHTFESDKMSVSIPKRNSVNTNTGNQLIYGRQRPRPRYRPTAKVRFRNAFLKVHGLKRDIALVDLTGRYPDAFFRS